MNALAVDFCNFLCVVTFLSVFFAASNMDKNSQKIMDGRIDSFPVPLPRVGAYAKLVL